MTMLSMPSSSNPTNFGALADPTRADVPPADPSASGDSSLALAGNPVATSDVFGSSHFDANALTPDALLTYLGTRLGGLDKQVNDIFTREQKGEQVRGELREIQKLLTTVESGPNPGDKGTIKDLQGFAAELDAHLQNIAATDPAMAQQIRDHLSSPGQILANNDDQFTTAELDATKDYLNMVNKDLESGSQLDMISLQSLMSARQTAIQLATNLVAACADSAKSIASNIR